MLGKVGKKLEEIERGKGKRIKNNGDDKGRERKD